MTFCLWTKFFLFCLIAFLQNIPFKLVSIPSFLFILYIYTLNLGQIQLVFIIQKWPNLYHSSFFLLLFFYFICFLIKYYISLICRDSDIYIMHWTKKKGLGRKVMRVYQAEGLCKAWHYLSWVFFESFGDYPCLDNRPCIVVVESISAVALWLIATRTLSVFSLSSSLANISNLQGKYIYTFLCVFIFSMRRPPNWNMF